MKLYLLDLFILTIFKNGYLFLCRYLKLTFLISIFVSVLFSAS